MSNDYRAPFQYTKEELDKKILTCKDMYLKNKRKAQEFLDTAKMAKQEMEYYEGLREQE